LKKTREILKAAVRNLKEDEPIIYCAAIAFFTLFSLPAIIMVMVLVGAVFLDRATQ
jgi:membrane protein